SDARSINSSGQIVGYGLKSNGETHAFLLTPPSGPPTACLPTVNVSVSPSAMNEDAVGSLTYTFTRSITTGSPLVVSFSTTGTADSSDYGISQSGSVTIPANQPSATVVVDPTTDFAVEPNETVILTTTAGAGYNIGTPTSATGTINNDDVTNVSVAVTPSSANEDGATNLDFTFTRNSTIGSLAVNFSVGGTADATTDYSQTGATTFTPPTGTVTFANGSSTATVTVNPSTDSTVELDETVSLTVSGGSGYIVGSPSAATGTITNDDTDVSVTVSPLSVTESDTPNLVYTFTRTGVTTGALTVNFSVGGTADASDYAQTGATTFTPPTGSVTFANGNNTATVTVDPASDSTVEPDETVILTLTADASYTIGSPGAATGTITNDDTDVIVTLSPTSVTESDTPNLVYTFTRTGVTTGALTVNFSVAGTATLNTDYSQTGATTFDSSAGTVTLSAGSSSAAVTLDPTPDATLEGDENVTLTVTSGSGYNVGSPSSTQGTITPDAPLVFTEEGNGSFAVAIDSVTFVKGPFKLTNEWNLTPSDRATRVILITSNLGMTQADLATGILTVSIAGYGTLPIENVGPITGVAGLSASFIIVRLPGELQTLNPSPGPNNLTLTVKMGSATSNATILSITP
ncbi:MAG: Calx-beta domain-containing protein, partial [Pyrinomonadaceae bacterium]